jgi:hypothetical protein
LSVFTGRMKQLGIPRISSKDKIFISQSVTKFCHGTSWEFAPSDCRGLEQQTHAWSGFPNMGIVPFIIQCLSD